MTPPTSEELGYADKVFMDELGDTSVVIFRMFDKVIDTFIHQNYVQWKFDDFFTRL